MPCPALSPEHASQLAFPTTGRLPSTPSVADAVGLVRGFIGSTQPSDSSCLPGRLRNSPRHASDHTASLFVGSHAPPSAAPFRCYLAVELPCQLYNSPAFRFSSSPDRGMISGSVALLPTNASALRPLWPPESECSQATCPQLSGWSSVTDLPLACK